MKEININDGKIDDFDFLMPESELVFYDNEHGFCINTQDALDSVNRYINECIKEVKQLTNFHSYEVPIEYGDGTQTTEKICPLYEIDSILNMTFGVFEEGE